MKFVLHLQISNIDTGLHQDRAVNQDDGIVDEDDDVDDDVDEEELRPKAEDVTAKCVTRVVQMQESARYSREKRLMAHLGLKGSYLSSDYCR